ncbi:hypothetical protein AWC11_11360 [Mycobacterium interjectum]|nr:hypothetical protein AWC11_11360 [Mycobacterium interjectum]
MDERKRAAIDAANALVRAAQGYDDGGPDAFVGVVRLWLADLDKGQLVTVAVELAAVLSLFYGADPFTYAGQRIADDIQDYLDYGE